MRFYDTSPTTTDFEPTSWFKSSFSGSNGATCVEVNLGTPKAAGVRDSKLVASPVLEFPPRSWEAFTNALNRDTAG